jgi:phosphatidylglycerol:prolipoprotein diacylglycerol transferase
MQPLMFPAIDPIALQLGPIAIRWYALAYIAGLVIGWRVLMALGKRPGSGFTSVQADNALVWVAGGVILGGRLGYVLFYKPGYYLFHPQEILFLWQGGMSFHGGMLGVVIAVIWYCRRNNIPLLRFADGLALVAPIGLFFGRIANFINGELWGRAADVSWAMVFPRDPAQLPRHPSQLYQAALEGLILLVVLWALRRHPRAAQPGFLAGVFLAGYGVARIIGEFFREPDAHLGFFFTAITMGQILSLPMLLAGVYLIATAPRRAA